MMYKVLEKMTDDSAHTDYSSQSTREKEFNHANPKRRRMLEVELERVYKLKESVEKAMAEKRGRFIPDKSSK